MGFVLPISDGLQFLQTGNVRRIHGRLIHCPIRTFSQTRMDTDPPKIVGLGSGAVTDATVHLWHVYAAAQAVD